MSRDHDVPRIIEPHGDMQPSKSPPLRLFSLLPAPGILRIIYLNVAEKIKVS